MGLGFCAWIVLAAPTLSAPSPPAHSFTEAWYREVVLGEIAAAGDLYQKIFQDTAAAPSRDAHPVEVRLRAALRTGGCFEKLGDGSRAREAYAWLVGAGPPGDPSVRYARLRLLSIPAEGSPSETSAAPAAPAPSPAPASAAEAVPAPPRPEGVPVLDRLRARIERREACARDFKDEAVKLAQRVNEETRLRRRLEELGVEIELSPGESPKEAGAGVPIGESARALDPEDRGLLSLVLADLYYLRGLRALRDRDPAAAVEEFLKALEFQPDYRDAPDLLHTAKGFLRPMEGMAKLAAQRLEDRRAERELAIVRTLRAALARADQLTSQEQVPAALQELERARSEEEWAPPAVFRAEEASALAREADVRALLASLPPPGAQTATGGEAQRYDDLRMRGRRAIDDLISAAEDMIDLSWASSDRRHPALSGSGASAAAEKDGMEDLRRVGEELERLLLRGEDKYRLKPQDRSQEGWRREFLDIRILTQWFPGCDKDQRFRKLAQEYLER